MSGYDKWGMPIPAPWGERSPVRKMTVGLDRMPPGVRTLLSVYELTFPEGLGMMTRSVYNREFIHRDGGFGSLDGWEVQYLVVAQDWTKSPCLVVFEFEHQAGDWRSLKVNLSMRDAASRMIDDLTADQRRPRHPAPPDPR